MTKAIDDSDKKISSENSYQRSERDLLLNKPQELNDYLKTCLFNAVIEINAKAVRNILEENPSFDVNSKDQYGRTAFAVAYLQKDLQNTYQRKSQLKKNSSIEEIESVAKDISENDEDDTNARHEKILALLLPRTDFEKYMIDTSNHPSRTTEHKHPPITESKTKRGEIKKTILHFAVNPETPPSDLICFLLYGAKEETKNSEWKKPIDCIPANIEEEMELHKKILKIGIPRLFELENFELLTEIIQKDEGKKNCLFKSIYNSVVAISKKLDTTERTGMFYYTLLTYPNAESRDEFKKSIKDRPMLLFAISTSLTKAAKAMEEKNASNASHIYQQAAELGDMNAMLQLANLYVKHIDLGELKTAVDVYKKFVTEGDITELEKNFTLIIKNLIVIAYQTKELSAKKEAIFVLRSMIINQSEEKASYQQVLNQIEFLSILESDPNDHSNEIIDVQNIVIKNYAILINQSISDEQRAELYVKAMSNPKLKEAILKETIKKEEQAASLGELLWHEGQKFHTLSNRLAAEMKGYQEFRERSNFAKFHKLIAEKKSQHAYVKAKLNSYIEQAAQLGNTNAIGYIIQNYLDKNEQLQAIRFCADSYKLVFSEKDKKIILNDYLIGMIADLQSNDEENSAPLKIAFNELGAIYQRRWAENKSLISLLEKIEYLELLEKSKGNVLRKEELVENIIDEFDSLNLLNNLNDFGMGDLFSRLLTHTNVTLANKVKAKLEESSQTQKICNTIELVVEDFDSKDQTKLNRISAELGNSHGLYRMANYYINHEIGEEWDKAITAFRSAYARFPHDNSRKEVEVILQRMQKSEDQRKRQAATDLLGEIALLHDSFYKSVRRAIELLEIPEGKYPSSTIIDLGNGATKTVPSNIAAQWNSVMKQESIAAIIDAVRESSSYTDGLKEYYELFSSTDMQDIIKKCKQQQTNVLQATDACHIWAKQPDGILKILNQDINRLEVINNGRCPPDSKKTMQEYYDMEKMLNDAMEEWVKRFGESHVFNKIDSARQHQLSHRILEFGIGLKNPLAQKLAEQLTNKWQADTNAPKTLLSQFNLKKEKFIAAVSVTVKKPWYQRLFSDSWNKTNNDLPNTKNRVDAGKNRRN